MVEVRARISKSSEILSIIDKSEPTGTRFVVTELCVPIVPHWSPDLEATRQYRNPPPVTLISHK